MAHKKTTVISITSDKGGVGKTASTAAFGHLLSMQGKRVLLIDSDPQGNLSTKFGFHPYNQYDNYLGNLLANRMDKSVENAPITSFINKSERFPNLDIIVSDQRLDQRYTAFSLDPVNTILIFKKIVAEIKELNEYDYIIFDTRPALKSEVASAFIASDWLLIPVLPSVDSIWGANDIFNYMATCKDLNPGLRPAGVFFNKVSSRTKAFQEMQPYVQETWADLLLETAIPQSQDVVNAENKEMPVTEYKPSCKTSKAFQELLTEVVNYIEQQA